MAAKINPQVNSAVAKEGVPVCWGNNLHGQATPPPGEVFEELSAGQWVTCGLKASGDVRCWGMDEWGITIPIAFGSIPRAPLSHCARNNLGIALFGGYLATYVGIGLIYPVLNTARLPSTWQVESTIPFFA